jgi:kinesin family protein 5
MKVKEVSEHTIWKEQDVLDLLKIGNKNRKTSATLMNQESSRSHSIFSMTVKMKRQEQIQYGTLYLVDLAGSESLEKSQVEGIALQESKKINQSLTTLGLVINQIVNKQVFHVHYRDSKLTHILQDSLGGNAKTCLILNCSPSSVHQGETISTLRFGQTASKIVN